MTTATPETDGTMEGTEIEGGAHHGGGAFPPLDPAHFPSQLLWLAIAFGLLYLLMSRVALPRVGSMLEARRSRISGDLAKAKALKEETEAVIADYEAKLASARKEASSIAQAARDAVNAELDKERGEVEAKLSAKIAEAEARIKDTKAKAMADVTSIAKDAAAYIVASLTGAKVSETDASKAVSDANKG
jgi:F-type H+-transporting ATPase subunit b